MAKVDKIMLSFSLSLPPLPGCHTQTLHLLLTDFFPPSFFTQGRKILFLLFLLCLPPSHQTNTFILYICCAVNTFHTLQLLLLSPLLNSQCKNFFNYPCLYLWGWGTKALFWQDKEPAEEREGRGEGKEKGGGRRGGRKREVKGEIPQWLRSNKSSFIFMTSIKCPWSLNTPRSCTLILARRLGYL